MAFDDIDSPLQAFSFFNAEKENLYKRYQETIAMVNALSVPRTFL